MDKLIKHSFFKAFGLLLVTSSLGVAVVGFARYNAKASEVLPKLSIPRSITAKKSEAERLHLFSMEIVGGQSHYDIFETELVDRGGEIKAILRIQKSGQDTEAREYEKVIEEETFVTFWKALRDLEVAQLTNLSPSTENIGEDVATPVFRTTRTTASATYGFKFQDGLYDYPNSFKVYAPDELQDTRYRKLRDLTEAFVSDIFDEVV